MSYARLLTDKVDIYSATTSAKEDYGIKSDEISYPTTPTYTNVKCYAVRNARNSTMYKSELSPTPSVKEIIVFHFLISASIIEGDKLVFEGDTFIIQKPRKIRNHHIEVEAVRSEYL